MDAERFAELVAALLEGHSRRNALRGLIAGAAAALGAFAGTERSEAGKAAKRRKRRKRRLRKQLQKRRRRCLNACGETCNFCFYAVSGEVLCGVGHASGCAPCASDANCSGNLRCVNALQFRGEAEQKPVCMNLGAVCASISACPPA